MPRQSSAAIPPPEAETQKADPGSQPSVGFPPIARSDARVLLLGTLPGTASLARQQYYAQPRNGFWPILATLLGFDPALAYAQRAGQLSVHGIALWDVCRSGVRPGSLDSAIQRASILPNDFAGFLPSHPALRVLAFNGRTAESLFRSLVLPALPVSLAALPTLTLPSTSPAYASMRFAEKLDRWRVLLNWLA